MKKIGILQGRPVVKRVIYLSREASKELNRHAKRYNYTPSELTEIILLEEFENCKKIESAIEKSLAKRTKNK